MAALSGSNRGVAAAFSGLLLVSLDSLMIRLANVSAWSVAFWFGAFATISTFLLVMLTEDGGLGGAWSRSSGPILLSGFLQMGSTLLFILAVQSTSVANVVVIVAAAPLATAVIGWMTLGERIAPTMWVAIGSTVLGIVVIVGGSLSLGGGKGELLAAGAVLLFASNVAVWRKFPDMNRKLVVGLGAFLVFLIAIPSAQPTITPIGSIGILAIMGGITGPLGRIAIASATRYLAAANVALFAPVETVAASTWAAIAFGERLTIQTTVGGAIVLISLVVGTVGARSHSLV